MIASCAGALRRGGSAGVRASSCADCQAARTSPAAATPARAASGTTSEAGSASAYDGPAWRDRPSARRAGQASLSKPSCARGAAAAPCSAAAPRGSRARCRPRPRSCRRARRRAARRRAARRRGSRPPRASRARAAARPRSGSTSASSNSSTPSSRSTCGTRLSAKSVRRCRSSAGATPGEREVGGGDLGALEERDAQAVVARHVVPGRPRRERLREPLGRPVGRAHEAEEAPEVLDRDALAELAQRAREQRHQLVGRVLAEGGRDRGRLDRRQLGRRPRPAGAQGGLDRAEAREPAGLAQGREPAGAEVDRVERERERGALLEAGAHEVGRGRRLGLERARVRLDRGVHDPDARRAAGHLGAARADVVEQRAQPSSSARCMAM